MKKNCSFILILFFIIFLLGGIYIIKNQNSELKTKTETSIENESIIKTETISEKDISEISISKNPVSKIPVSEIPFLEIPLCPKNALIITNDETHGVLDTLQKEDSHQIINHTGYTLCYREKFEQPEWVSYTLDSIKTQKAVKRNDNFRPDPFVITGSAALSDYKKSGFDRGHMAPSADMTYSDLTMDESFFLSNMSPQTADLNRGLWKELEQYIRTLTESFNILYIVTGPILEKENYETIGFNKVAVPEFYYKALCGIKNKSWFAIGFILPNEKCSGGIFDYAVSVDEIEKRTGLDFFSLLDDETEDIIEKEVKINDWK